MPVSRLIPRAPSGGFETRTSDFVPQVHADDPGVVPIPLCELPEALEELLLGVLLIVPKAIPVTGTTAPLGFTGMVVQDHHQSGFG